ncbi:MAG TPA: phosphatase PAP2 family protein [bacterium]|nr:phosphatase PAP2 family protein [bacterium]
MQIISRIVGIDTQVQRWLDRQQYPALLTKFMRCLSLAGSEGLIWFILSGWLSFRLQRFDPVLLLGMAELVQFAVVGLGLKMAVKRQRPHADREQILFYLKLDEYAFPSGHAASSFAALPVLAFFAPELTVGLAGLAGVVSISRLYLGRHYVSDIGAGICIGYAIGWICLRIYLQIV